MRKIRLLRSSSLLVTAILAVLFTGSITAVESVTISSDSFDRINLVEHLEVLKDPLNTYTIEDVEGPLYDMAFVTATKRNTNIGYSSSTYWIRFSLDFTERLNQSVWLVLDAPMIDHIQLYSPKPNGDGYDVVDAGDSLPFREREIDHRNFVFPIASGPRPSSTYYAQIRSSTSPIGLPLYIYSQDGFSETASRSNLLFGAYFGIMSLLIFASIAANFLFKRTSCLWYAAYLATYCLFQASTNGFSYQFFWPQYPILQAKLPGLFCGLTVVFGVGFVIRFLELKSRAPNIERIMVLLAIISSVASVYQFLDSGNYGIQVVIASCITCSALIFAAAVNATIAGYRPARLFLVGWALYLIGVMITSSHVLGLAPNVAATAYAMQIGSIFQTIFVLLALVHQINEERSARDAEVYAAQEALLKMNNSLERRVRDRTEELEIRNQELVELAVRDGLTGLYNHSTSIELLHQEVEHAKRYEFSTAVMMIDIDDFKLVNDNFGHPIGDKVVVAVSKTLTDGLRSADIVGRYGGDEFLIVLSHAGVAAARAYGERLLARVRDIEIKEMGTHKISASIGIAILDARSEDVATKDLIQRADEAMYKSKRAGRDRLTLANPSLIVAKEG